jgi:predicted transcriptional regulator
MIRTQIYLTKKERDELKRLARESGRKQSELIREAIDEFVERRQPQRTQAILDSLAGVWKDKADLPDVRRLRDEWNREGR